MHTITWCTSWNLKRNIEEIVMGKKRSAKECLKGNTPKQWKRPTVVYSTQTVFCLNGVRCHHIIIFVILAFHHQNVAEILTESPVNGRKEKRSSTRKSVSSGCDARLVQRQTSRLPLQFKLVRLVPIYGGWPGWVDLHGNETVVRCSINRARLSPIETSRLPLYGIFTAMQIRGDLGNTILVTTG